MCAITATYVQKITNYPTAHDEQISSLDHKTMHYNKSENKNQQ